ncbi:MAG: protein kinase, partial [Pseudomonadota bacterium]
MTADDNHTGNGDPPAGTVATGTGTGKVVEPQPQPVLGLTIPAGTRISGIFEIEKQIGAGGMGMVYRAHNIETGDAVAIKIVRAELAGNEQVIALFRKEAAVLHKLFHDAIVRYYIFGSDQAIGRQYLATEFVDGTPLSDIIAAGPLARDDAIDLAERLADGLAAAHAVPIFHRDISPDNIILPESDVSRAKIIDFGIARAATIGGGTVIGDSIAGKFDYMSPEQLGLFGAQVDARSDIYSLGIVLAEAFLGRSLQMGGTQLEVVEKRRKVPDLSAVEPGLRALLTAMTQPKPDDRIASMADVAAEARALRSGKGTRRSSNRSRVPAFLGVVALLAAGGAGYLYLAGSDESGSQTAGLNDPGRAATDPEPPALARTDVDPTGTPDADPGADEELLLQGFDDDGDAADPENPPQSADGSDGPTDISTLTPPEDTSSGAATQGQSPPDLDPTGEPSGIPAGSAGDPAINTPPEGQPGAGQPTGNRPVEGRPEEVGDDVPAFAPAGADPDPVAPDVEPAPGVGTHGADDPGTETTGDSGPQSAPPDDPPEFPVVVDPSAEPGGRDAQPPGAANGTPTIAIGEPVGTPTPQNQGEPAPATSGTPGGGSITEATSPAAIERSSARRPIAPRAAVCDKAILPPRKL